MKFIESTYISSFLKVNSLVMQSLYIILYIQVNQTTYIYQHNYVCTANQSSL